ncbi:BrnA antitoxin family protein [Patescibacteria group bacterium]|nr:BrnA antitoxin family protein [Patescibacteria group bacterium]
MPNKKNKRRQTSLKQIPKFKNEDEERNFWAKADSSEYFDWDNPVELDLSKLKPTTESISLRLPGYLLMRIKEIANARDVPYQSLMKIFLAERVEKELRKFSYK